MVTLIEVFQTFRTHIRHLNFNIQLKKPFVFIFVFVFVFILSIILIIYEFEKGMQLQTAWHQSQWPRIGSWHRELSSDKSFA